MTSRSFLVVASTLSIGLFYACGGQVVVPGGNADGGGDGACGDCHPVPTTTQVSCPSASPGAPPSRACTGIPKDPWAGPGATASSGGTYPVGCRVTYPHENPYYPGSPQTCDCEQIRADAPPEWVCPL